MNFKELVMSNRTCRRYDESKKVSREDLLDLVELARYTPSGINKQAIRFAVVNDNLDDIFKNIRWAGYLKDWDGPKEGERPTGYIVFATDQRYGNAMLEDVGIVSQTIALGARAKGMAACIFKSHDEAGIKEALSLSDDYKVVLVISIGYPVEKVVVDDIREGEDIKYYRDENEVHHVPKIVLEDLLIK